jgi:hypothetical protein
MIMRFSVCLAVFVSLFPSVMTAQAPSSAQAKPDLRSEGSLAKESYFFESIQNRFRFEADGKVQPM